MIICSCLCSNLRTENAKNVLTPELAPLLNMISYAQHPLFATVHISFFAQALISVQWNLPSWEPRALLLACLSLPFALPDAHFPWESRLLRTAAAAVPACSCCSKTGQHGSAVLPLRTDFFFSFILENLVGLCQLWAQCQLSLVCP